MWTLFEYIYADYHPKRHGVFKGTQIIRSHQDVTSESNMRDGITICDGCHNLSCASDEFNVAREMRNKRK